LEAYAAGELDELRRLVLARLAQAKIELRLGTDPTVLRGLIRCARPNLKEWTASKWAGLLRWALYSGCRPDELPRFVAKEGIEKGSRRFAAQVKRELRVAKGVVDDSAGNARGHGQIKGNAKPVGPGVKSASVHPPDRPTLDADAGTPPIVGAVPFTVWLLPDTARQMEDVVKKGRQSRLLLRVLCDGEWPLVQSVLQLIDAQGAPAAGAVAAAPRKPADRIPNRRGAP
jgi:hypothetical protein